MEGHLTVFEAHPGIRQMDAKTFDKTRLPSRHVTEGPSRAPHRSYYYAMGLSREQIHQPFVGVASCWVVDPDGTIRLREHNCAILDVARGQRSACDAELDLFREVLGAERRRLVEEVAPQRDLTVIWRSYCLEIRDDYGVAPTMPEDRREIAIAAHALSHRMLRIFEAARARSGEEAVDPLLSAWGRAFFVSGSARDDTVLSECLTACGADADLLEAADDEKWDTPIIASMQVAYAFGGPKTQTPTIVVCADPPYGFKGPVMAPAPMLTSSPISASPRYELWCCFTPAPSRLFLTSA